MNPKKHLPPPTLKGLAIATAHDDSRCFQHAHFPVEMIFSRAIPKAGDCIHEPRQDTRFLLIALQVPLFRHCRFSLSSGLYYHPLASLDRCELSTRDTCSFSLLGAALAPGETLLGIIEVRRFGAEELILYCHVIDRSSDEADDHDEPSNMEDVQGAPLEPLTSHHPYSCAIRDAPCDRS